MLTPEGRVSPFRTFAAVQRSTPLRSAQFTYTARVSAMNSTTDEEENANELQFGREFTGDDPSLSNDEKIVERNKTAVTRNPLQFYFRSTIERAAHSL